MKKYIFSLFNSDFVKHVGVLSSGNILAQIILFASAPIITRIYTPSDFGLFALYFSFVSIFSKIGTMCYERAIVLPKNKKESVSIIVLSLAIHLSIITLVLISIFIFGKEIASLLDSQKLEFWLYFVPLSIMLESTQNIFRLWLIKEGKISSVSYSKISNAGASSTIKIVLGFLLGTWVGGLILGSVFGGTVGLVILLYKSNIREIYDLINDVNRCDIYYVSSKYRSFPFYATPSAIFNIVSEQMAIFLFSIFFGPVIVGFYALSGRLLKQPVVVFSASVGNIFTKKSAVLFSNNKKILPALIKTQITLVLLGFIPFLLLWLYGDNILSFIFGKKWEEAGIYAMIMSPWFFVLFVAAPTTAIYEVLLKQKLRLFINVITWILRTIALIGGYYISPNVVDVLTYFVIVNVFMELVSILVSYDMVYKSDAKNTLIMEL